MTRSEPIHEVNFAPPRPFGKVLKAKIKETLFPDDPFHQFNGATLPIRIKQGVKYFVPIFEWLPNYTLSLFKYDLLAGITIASLAIPQGISYAKLANIEPIVGLYSSFVPPLIYAVFGNSKHLAVGTVAACSLLIAQSLQEVVSPTDDPHLYMRMIYTATFISGVVQTLLGFLRLGILVDFLSHSTIVGFMGGTATLISLQQLRGMLGLNHFTQHTDVINVLKAVFKNRDEWKWEPAVIGVIFLSFLQFTRYVKQKKPSLFWVSAIAPMVVVVVGGLFAFLTRHNSHGIQVVGTLKRGINPSSIKLLIFDNEHIQAPLKAGIITALIALAEGMAIGRSFAIMKNEQVDGNKEMIAFGFMNIIGSFTSCYLTTGPFSKTAVNFNAGCKSQMSNVVMAVCMLLTLLVLAPLFSYTPLVALSAIIMSAMLGLIDYQKIYHLFKVDKFDFCICMAAFIGVAFVSMDMGLMMSVGLALVRALLYVARPATSKLERLPDSTLYRDIEQYPNGTKVPGFLVLQLGSPIYFANANYIRERIMRWVRDEESAKSGEVVEYVILELGGVTTIDITGVETLLEVRRNLQAKDVKMILVNPRLEVMEKLLRTKFVAKIGKESIFLAVDEAIEACRFLLKTSKTVGNENHV
ncbi:transporter [Lithospermum erythrorhizon]|uniref:Transporter n=1 Tax=Lithospermum erythrorhizon TaxID=34254 RepID=A0AAV3P5B4_LITER